MYFRCNLKKVLEEKNVSLNKLSINTNISRSTLNDYKQDRIKLFHRGILEKVCEYLDCEIDDILVYESGQSEYEI